MSNGICLETLAISIPLPPPDNQCHRSGQYSRYATKAYRDWIGICGPILREALGDHTPDTENWWLVEVLLWLPLRCGDPQNYLKAVFDLLSGSTVDSDGKIAKPGALWDDDKRCSGAFSVVEFNCDEGQARITAKKIPAPVDRRRLNECIARLKRQQAQDQARKAREAEKARLFAEQAAARWNAKHSTGTWVAIRDAGDGEECWGITTSAAYTLGNRVFVLVNDDAVELSTVRAETRAERTRRERAERKAVR